MHTLVTHGVTFHYSSDLSGHVYVQPDAQTEIKVPGEALLELVSDIVRMAKISKLEQAEPAELLGLK